MNPAAQRIGQLVVLACGLAMGSGPAYAVDGTILIDQNKAAAGGVTPGDAPGFPVTITRPGSYRLASNLIVPDANTNAIEIAPNTPAVTIDLNGFAIIGPAVCSGFPPACTPSGSGVGILDASGSSRGTAVRNGTITGLGSNGITLFSPGGAVDEVTIRSNGGTGILLEVGTMTRNRIIGNAGAGISGGNAVITHNLVAGNGGVGIDANDSVVVNNVMAANHGVGLNAGNSGFGGNTFSSNNGGFSHPQFSGRVSIAPNSCDGSVCP